MEPHRPPAPKSDPSAPRKRPARRDRLPLGREWLEQEALRYVARWEASRRGVETTTLRKLEQRGERTGEDVEAFRSLVPEVVAGLVERGYIDDTRYAEQLFARMRRQGRSLAQIRARLHAKGIDPDLISAIEEGRSIAGAENGPDAGEEEAANEHEHSSQEEELEAARKTARKRRIGPYCPNPAHRRSHRERHLAVLARQGFSRDIAYAVIDAEQSADGEVLEGHAPSLRYDSTGLEP